MTKRTEPKYSKTVNIISLIIGGLVTYLVAQNTPLDSVHSELQSLARILINMLFVPISFGIVATYTFGVKGAINRSSAYLTGGAIIAAGVYYFYWQKFSITFTLAYIPMLLQIAIFGAMIVYVAHNIFENNKE